MTNIRPVSDLCDYTKVLEEVSPGQPVFLTENGCAKYAITTIEEYEHLNASLTIVEELKKAESGGTIALSEAKKRFGI